ncbi:hypothetical protein EDD86DRAFT_246832 [Gorgonomyces haynaldii]|nr:hypothetical protein EDD86DRAFT_246832 [Gorgonomyces haynaldii]
MATISELPTLDPSLLLFSLKNYIYVSIEGSSHVIAIILTSIVILATFRQQQTTSSLLILSMCFGDMSLLLGQAVFAFYNLLNGRVAVGQIGCFFNGIFVIFGAYVSVLAVFFISVERYMAVVAERPISKKMAWWMIGSNLCFSSVVTFVPAAIPQRYYLFALQTSKEACAMAWWVRDPLHIWVNLSAVLTISVATSAVTVAYYCVIVKYLSLKSLTQPKRRMSIIQTVRKHSAEIQDVSLYKKERRLLIKCIAITLTFIIAWTGYFTKVLYEMIMQRPVDEDWDSIATTAVAFNALLNPILLYSLDNQIKSHVNDFFGIKKEETKLFQSNVEASWMQIERKSVIEVSEEL